MARFIKNREKSHGKAPGTLVHLGEKKVTETAITLYQYNKQNFREYRLPNLQVLEQFSTFEGVNWLNIEGIHDEHLIRELGEWFGLDNMLLEDMMDTDQRPKYDDAESYDAFILKSLHFENKKSRFISEQLTLIVNEKFVITVVEKSNNMFNQVLERIKNNKGRVRLNEHDYLAYALMDNLFDSYSLIVEKMGERIENLEDMLFKKRYSGVSEKIYEYKVELNYLRKAIRPVRDIMVHLLKSDNSYFQEKNQKYLNDLNDLILLSTDAVELYGNMLSDQLNAFHSDTGNRMNEVMKVLTIFASIFIPLTFLAGIYGMNFVYFPELNYKYAYPLFWGVAIVIGLSLLYYFRRKKWL